MKNLKLFENFEEIKIYEEFDFFKKKEKTHGDIDPYDEEDWNEIESEETIKTDRLKFFIKKTGLVFIMGYGEGNVRIMKITGGKRKEKTKKKKGKIINIIDVDELHLKSPELDPDQIYVLGTNWEIDKICHNFKKYRNNYLLTKDFNDDEKN